MGKTIIATKVLAKKSKLASAKRMSDLFDRVLKAVSTDETRYNITMGYWDYESKALVATDGRRLHFLKSGMLNEFFSDIAVSCFVERQGDMVVLYDKSYAAFPNWKNVVPDSEKLEKVQIESNQVGKYEKSDFVAYFSNKKLMHDNGNLSLAITALGLRINTSYLLDLIGGDYTVERTPMGKYDQREHRACKLVEDRGETVFTAVLMPMQPIFTFVR